MTESLQRFQKVSKLGKILSTIVFVLSCVVALAMVVGVIIMIIYGSSRHIGGWDTSYKRGGATIIEEWFSDIGINQNFRTIIGLHLGVMVLAAIEAVFSFWARKFFKGVVKAGTPSTEEGAKAARNLAIFSFVLPGVALLLCYIGMVIMHAIWNDVEVVLTAQKALGYGVALGVWVAFGVGFGLGLCFLSNMAKQSVEEKKALAAAAAEEVKPAPKKKAAPVKAAPKKAEPKPAPVVVAPVVAEKEEKAGVSYDKSFTAKLMQAKDETKDYYSIIKNEILSYKGKGKKISNRISWKYETFNIGRDNVIKLKVKGKTLCAYFALNAKKYADTKYKVEDVSKVKADADTPMMYRINNERRAKYVADLVADLMGGKEFSKVEIEKVDYAKQFPMRTNATLVKNGLAKKVKAASFPKNI